MKHPDEAIDKLLSGLRTAAPSSDMERRIREAVERQATEPTRLATPLWLSMPPRRFPLWTAASIATLTLLFAATWTLHTTQHANQAPSLDTPSLPGAPSTQSLPGAPSLAASPPRVESQANLNPHPRTTPARPETHRHDEQTTALTELQAPSLPEPPMPLTTQEKLLLSIAHAGDPREYAMLNPDLRTEQEAKGNQAFQQVFQTPINTLGDHP